MTDMLPLYAELQGHPKIEIIKHYARACIAHATAAQAAEIEALQEQLEWAVKQNDMLLDEGRKLTARAERLAEALKGAVDDIAEWGEPAKGAHVDRIYRQLKNALLREQKEIVND